VHLVGFTIEIYHYERQTYINIGYDLYFFFFFPNSSFENERGRLPVAHKV
jgi:hypothetical protein